MYVDNERRVFKPVADLARFGIVGNLKFEMTFVKVEDFDDANTVIVVAVGNEGFAVVVFSNFCDHSTGDDFISDGFEGDLGDEFFEESGVRFWCKDRRCFGFNAISVAMLDGADIYEDLRKFRIFGVIGSPLEQGLLLVIKLHCEKIVIYLFSE